MKLKKMALLTLISGGILYGICTDLAYAGALYIYETGNPTDTGYAGAGLAGRATDAGTVFTNPAGMTRFQDSTFLAGVTPLYLYAPFNPDQDTTVSGSDGDTNEFFAGGSFAYIRPVTERLRLGVSVQNFFGLALDWGNNWVGRYEATEVALIAPQLQPTVAYKVNNWLSLGAGAGLTLGYLKDEARVDNLEPNLGDGRLKYDDTDFAVQGNFGVMIEPSDRTRIGLRYLTETDLDFEDDVKLSGLGPAFDDPLVDLTTPANGLDLGMKMPQSLMAGIFHQVNDEWAVLGSVGWDDWSRFERIHVRVEGTSINRVVDAGFDDTYHFGVGTQYQYSPKLMLTAGFSYDSSMLTGSTRPIMLPLGAMYRYGLGFKYKKSDDLLLGGGLSFLWEGDLKVKPGGGGAAGQVSGQYDNVNITFLSFYAQW
jgi:long-chain fatty acid transport protein